MNQSLYLNLPPPSAFEAALPVLQSLCSPPTLLTIVNFETDLRGATAVRLASVQQVGCHKVMESHYGLRCTAFLQKCI